MSKILRTKRVGSITVLVGDPWGEPAQTAITVTAAGVEVTDDRLANAVLALNPEFVEEVV